MRTFGSPKTPRTTGSGRNPSNEYVSQSRRRRFDSLTIHNLCQILNPAKMQNIPEIPRPVPLQALKSTHSIPRRPPKISLDNGLCAIGSNGVTDLYQIRAAAKPEGTLRDPLSK